MQILDDILTFLADGKEHTINEITAYKPLRYLANHKLMTMLNFLAEYNFIRLNEDLATVQLNPRMQAFMHEIKWLERAECQKKQR